jgi:hypothetical protein
VAVAVVVGGGPGRPVRAPPSALLVRAEEAIR